MDRGELSSGRGKLVVAATPIGNLGDVTPRVIEALKACDAVLAEDTRVTAKLLSRYRVTTRLERCDEHVIRAQAASLVERIGFGEHLVLVSDAGTPGVSDPGALLVAAVLDAGLDVEVLPGPSAVITALVSSGLPTDRFYFGGFLPRKRAGFDRLSHELGALDATLVFYESPHRVAKSMAVLVEVFAGREAAVARELTKLHEEVVRGPIEAVAHELGLRERVKGEIVVLVGPPPNSRDARPSFEEADVLERARQLRSEGVSKSDTARMISQEFCIPRNLAYDLMLAQGSASPALKSHLPEFEA